MRLPRFPDFLPVEREDREVLGERLWRYQPTTSELTFARLFAWRRYYAPRWTLDGEHLLIVVRADDPEQTFALPPVGPPDRAVVTRRILGWLEQETGTKRPRIERADRRLVDELGDDVRPGPLEDTDTPETPAGAAVDAAALTDNPSTRAGASASVRARFLATPVRRTFDYVYRTDDLGGLRGRRFHAKRNHLHQLSREYDLAYAPMADEHTAACLGLLDRWCAVRECDSDLDLSGDREAVSTMLTDRETLGLTGGVLLADGELRAFSLGELLNPTTAVVHTEKADPLRPQLTGAMNQRFAAAAWSDVPLINREQDLGDPGLRRAKLSYRPEHLEEKFRLELLDDG